MRLLAPSVGSRLGHLDGARACAALLVVAVHVRDTVPALPLSPAVEQLFSLGHYAVTVFIVISGFSLGMGWHRHLGSKGWAGRFLVRRFWRIVPTYWAALALSVLLVLTVIGRPTGTIWDVVLPLDWRGVVVHLLLLQDLVAGAAPNHVFWSIAIEWHIYFLFPAILWALTRRGGALWCGVITLVVYAWWLTGTTQADGMTIQYVACFAVGVLAAVRSEDGDSTKRLVQLTAVALVASVAFSALLYLSPARLPAMNALADLPLAVVAAGSLGLMRLGALTWLARLLSARVLARTGLFAYSIYLVHAPLLQVVWQYAIPHDLGLRTQFLLLLGPGAALAVAGSWLFFQVAERPFLRSRPRATSHV